MSKISDGEAKRLSIFKRYANNLDILIGNGILTGITLAYPETYICPICLEQFPANAVKNSFKNFLTLEDVPPKSLGGKPIILTCKTCNNTIGHKIDYHLLDRMLEIDISKFLPNSERRAKFKIGDNTVGGTISVDDNGKIQVYHPIKSNHPSKLESFIGRIKNKVIKPKINIEFNTTADTNKLQLALLKIGYLMTFAKFGYAFILDKSYDRVREQLLNPETLIYPTDFWFEGPFPKEHFGVPFITEKNMEAAFPLFSLITKSSERTFGTIIPLTNKQIEEVIGEVKARFAKTKTFEVEMYGFNGAVNYLTDIPDIKHLLNWIEKLKVK